MTKRLVRRLITMIALIGVFTLGMGLTIPSVHAAGIAEVAIDGPAYYHYARVCGWRTYDTWTCAQRGWTQGTYTGVTYFGTWLVERGISVEIHFDNYGTRRCDIANSQYQYYTVKVEPTGGCSIRW